ISPGDLEANYQGLLFYIGLCEGDDPIVEVRDGRWQRRRPFDFRDHVTPEWDESYQPVAFTKSRWKKVRPVLLGYCPMLDDPEVRAMRDAYRARDTTTPTELLLREFIASGRVPDPADFDIERVCAEAQSPA
ncbi:MAG: hypothetical protein R3190_18515, partial [Thermoanaerobaculia bacterium]|nr:hypothetical protein [Thermoanaerobaculia bacterium]